MKALQTAFLVTLLALTLTGSASASIFASGSISFVDVVFGYTGASLSVATNIELDLGGLGHTGNITSTSGSPFNCPQANCTPSLFDSPTPAPSQITELTTPSIFNVPLTSYLNFVQWGDGTNATRYSFSVLSSTSASLSTDTLTVFASGTFRDSLNVYATNNASLTMNFTQNGGGGGSGNGNAISLAGTISTLAAPEPATLFMFGGALIGLGLMRRKHFRR